VLDYILAAMLGLLSGFIFNKFAVQQITKRSRDPGKQDALKKPLVVILWMIISAFLFVALVFLYSVKYIPAKGTDYIVKVVEYSIYMAIVLNIAAVDFSIRKIPNELLLALMLVKIIFSFIALVRGTSAFDVVLTPVIGLAVGFLLFSVPSVLKINIGAGDIKFSAVIGFCLGYYLFLQAMILMAVILLVYLLFLLITRKGNLKTATAMGPYLAIGTVLTMLFPLSESLIK